MAGFSTGTNESLIRSNLWSSQLKKIQEDDLFGTRWVRMLTDFPDGTTINIPSIGQAEVRDYIEGNAIQYTAMDQGNFTFTIAKYKSSATWITDKEKQDSYYSSQLIASFIPSQSRALAVALEIDMLKAIPIGQTAANANSINGYYHRWVGSGTNETIDVTDFAKAQASLKKANAPMTNMIAVLDPSAEYKLATQTNLVNFLSPVPKWNDVISSGLSQKTGMQFKGYNIYGFDVYTSNNLYSGLAETINSKTTTTAAANLFFTAAGGDANPIIGLIRQSPRVEFERNKDFQRDEYLTTCRYDFKLYRPENVCVVLTDTDQAGTW